MLYRSGITNRILIGLIISAIVSYGDLLGDKIILIFLVEIKPRFNIIYKLFKGVRLRIEVCKSLIKNSLAIHWIHLNSAPGGLQEIQDPPIPVGRLSKGNGGNMTSHRDFKKKLTLKLVLGILVN